MAESRSPNRLLNFWKLHFQKIGLELKCSLCLNLLNQPILLPCDHIFCSPCVPKTTASGSDCPICFVHFVDKDLRPTPHMENILNIYKSMNAALGTIAFQTALQADTTDGQLTSDDNNGRGLNQMTHPSPSTTPSFGENKDSDDDHSDHGAEQMDNSLPMITMEEV